ncbi:ABC transporter permease [Streptomyces sparsogenes]|uniref:Dipeptide/oligopeptide/nickel ABC transporter permease n=1 Tax=Streptomyces sparsogenes DSM 40356 TaxID=1331668 RepID=A0A1R1SRU9_9ACTN|nr:ABC transporter permease [Streptomyces sparsogenes]OMI41041.1 dipeptide/oligopeptide/nickel ABC transporter permease [Streptomyces sparsogenes DSM 40356]
MRYVLRKLGFYAVAAWMAVTVNFFLPRLIPGDPVQLMMARMSQSGPVEPGQEEALAAMLGLSHGNLLTQYGDYLSSVVHLDFGLSVTYFPSPVTDVLHDALPWTLVLVGAATLISFVLGLTLGTLAGWRRGSWLDSLVPSTTFLAAVPYFWLALLLLYLFGQVWGVLPLGGGYDETLDIGLNGDFLSSALEHAVLPAATIVLSSVGGWMLGMRNMMVSTLAEDYVTAAEAKGLRPRTVMVGYAARNAVLPSVAGFAISLGFIVSGSLVMEIVFSYPGMGFTLLQAVENTDYPLMQAVFLVITFAVLAANFLVDLVYGFVDPRTRQAR